MRNPESWIEDLLEEVRASTVSIWAQGQTTHIPPPWLCYINLTNRCNSRCYFCGHGPAMRDDKGFMEWEVFQHIVSQLPDSIQKVYLIKQGEPFAHKEYETYLLHLAEKRPDIHIAMHTNAIIARKQRVEKVLPHIASLGVSISATDRETYKSVHQVDKFDIVMRNMGDINDLLLELPEDKRPHVFVDYVRAERNRHEDEIETVKFFADKFPAFNSVDFHHMYNYQGQIDEANLEVYEKLNVERFPRCVFPWSSITFLFDGNVSYCFTEPRETRFLGNILMQSFDEIWNGKDYDEFRRRMVEKKFDDLMADDIHCKECSWLWTPWAISPRNLAYGHATKLREKEPDPMHMVDVLQTSPEALFRSAANFYLSGEIHFALNYLQLLDRTCAPDHPLKEPVRELQEHCDAVLDKFADLSLWNDMIHADNGTTPESRQNTYYKV